jgi:predicted nucleic acid-binding protein
MIVYLDANVVIYLIEQNPVWGPKAAARLARARASGDELATSDAARLEVLVVPYRNADMALLAAYAAFFSDPDLHVFPLSAAVCEHAARIRAVQKTIRPPDNIHLAAAVEHGCGLFLTSDAQLARFPDIPVEVLT